MASKPTSKTTNGSKTSTGSKTKTPAADKTTTTLIANKSKIKTDIPIVNTPGDIDPHQFDVTAGQVDAGQVDLTDPNFNYDKVKAGTLADRFMTAADYTLLDPADVQNQFGDITRNEMRKNASLSSDLALSAIDTELQGLLNYAPTAANLQRQQVALDNTTNQSERLKMLDMADPNIKGDLTSQRDRATAYAEGRVPDSILDRQLELGIQSSAADKAASGGFGKGSSAAQKAGQLMSAQERVGLSQYGDQLLSSNINQRTSTLVADQQYAKGGSEISAMPSQSAGQIATSIASQANQGNITARDALENETQQAQFKAGLQQDANKTNLLTESQRDLNQAQLNLQADTTNTDNDIKTQVSAKEINSAERKFNVELKTNTAVSNADRAFQANNANAGRGLETATSNRAVKLQVETTNKNLVFQDQQRQKAQDFSAAQAAKAQAGANARAAAANSAANARAAMSAKAQAAALSAQQSEAQKDRDFQLQQQQQALDLYNKSKADAQNSQTWGTVGGIITKAPAIVSGVTSVINGVSSIFGSDSFDPGSVFLP